MLPTYYLTMTLYEAGGRTRRNFGMDAESLRFDEETIQALADQLLQRDNFEAVGLHASLDSVLAEWYKGGYDAVLGFSQGAILAAALCAELHRRGESPCFAIFVSGFGKPIPLGLEVFPPPRPLPVPSLHVWGQGDDHIPAWASKVLSEYFVEPKVHEHPGGHFMPQKAHDLNVMVDFVTAAAKAKETPAAQAPPAKSSSSSTQGRATTALRTSSSDELASPLKYYGLRSSAGPPIQRVIERPEEAPTPGAFLPEELEPPGTGTYTRLLEMLKTSGVDFRALGPHAPCRTSEDSVRVRCEGGWTDVTLHSGAKAMLLKAAKGHWLLAVLPADCKLSWKKVRASHGKATRMATEEEVLHATGCVPGAVPPIAAAFPTEVTALADETLPDVINFNCGLRTRSIQLSRKSYEAVQKPMFADIIEC
eukprot:TRINITY_DN29473_c0_g1_i2.p1 TRINITY_DN29473_c0_g1~~TRINITY_DN29473_c0_g1_i2.p1  ORF type:complete len:422 (-),score=88.98 TRINITY_DN29473_c0_g1_i2:53-1318(-)